ncbi:hypothetical protein Tco_0538687, partial [Tanacetum coccineum]
MTNENVSALAPIRSDDQILPFAAWVPIGKTIYIQQFLNALTYEEKTGAYTFQLDENRFTLDANLLMESLEIMAFVNELEYTEELYFVS